MEFQFSDKVNSFKPGIFAALNEKKEERVQKELPVYNPQNGKEICARENEKTALRHTDRENAYTHVHKDITLPYHGIGVIRVITAGGQMIEIIRNGRFVLRGTELLNEALRALEEQEEKTNETI